MAGGFAVVMHLNVCCILTDYVPQPSCRQVGHHYEALNASEMLVDAQNRTLRTVSSPDDHGLKVIVG